jgi:hypothetical protein
MGGYQKKLPLPQVAVLIGATLFLWANTHESQLVARYNIALGEEWTCISRYLFTRGWPISPWMVCVIHGQRFHPEDCFAWWALVFDAILGFFTLIALGVFTQWQVGSRKRQLSVIATRHPVRLHTSTKGILVFVVVAFFWANCLLSPSPPATFLQSLREEKPIVIALLTHTWPMVPWMFPSPDGDSWHREEWGVVVANWLIALDCLVFVGLISECAIHRVLGSNDKPVAEESKGGEQREQGRRTKGTQLLCRKPPGTL